MYDMITSPVEYGGLALKNRIIFAPTTLGLGREELVEKLRQIAAGGCAMIILGDVPVGRRGFGPSLYTKKGFAHYQMLTETIHRENCRVCAQLHQSDSNWKAMVKYLPGVHQHGAAASPAERGGGPLYLGPERQGGPPHHRFLWNGGGAGEGSRV